MVAVGVTEPDNNRAWIFVLSHRAPAARRNAAGVILILLYFKCSVVFILNISLYFNSYFKHNRFHIYNAMFSTPAHAQFYAQFCLLNQRRFRQHSFQVLPKTTRDQRCDPIAPPPRNALAFIYVRHEHLATSSEPNRPLIPHSIRTTLISVQTARHLWMNWVVCR